MPELTRRRSSDAREECWHVFYDDVRVGSIAIRAGNPDGTDPWQWKVVPAGAYFPSTYPRIDSRLRSLEAHTQTITAPPPRHYR